MEVNQYQDVLNLPLDNKPEILLDIVMITTALTLVYPILRVLENEQLCNRNKTRIRKRLEAHMWL